MVSLLDQALENGIKLAVKNGDAASLLNQTELVLESLLFFVENRYREYLSLDERIPRSYLNVLREETGGKMEQLKKLLHQACTSSN